MLGWSSNKCVLLLTRYRFENLLGKLCRRCCFVCLATHRSIFVNALINPSGFMLTFADIASASYSRVLDIANLNNVAVILPTKPAMARAMPKTNDDPTSKSRVRECEFGAIYHATLTRPQPAIVTKARPDTKYTNDKSYYLLILLDWLSSRLLLDHAVHDESPLQSTSTRLQRWLTDNQQRAMWKHIEQTHQFRHHH